MHFVGRQSANRGDVPSLDELHQRVAAAEQLVHRLQDLVLSLHREHTVRRQLVADDVDCY